MPDTPVRIDQGAAATVGGTEPEPELEPSSSADGHVSAPLASIGVAGVLSGGLGLPREPVAPDVLGVGMGKGAVELLPEDLRESYAQMRRKPGSALVRACRWFVVVAAYLVAGVGATTPFACGSTGDTGADSKQIIDLLTATKSVCCDQLHEQCGGKGLVPTTCHTAGCSRVVDLVAQACAPALADGFIGLAFKPELDLLVATCGAAENDPTPVYIISDPGLQAADTTTCHGRVIDGSASEFSIARTGQDAIVLRAPQGMQLRVAAETMHLPPHANVRFYDGATVDDPELGLLRGTSLPTNEQDREFVSSKGVLRVLRAVDLHDDAGLPLLFSLMVECVCTDGADGADGADGCGEHGSCVNGVCTCDTGRSGGMCETITDMCKYPFEKDCGPNGSCVDGSCACSSGAYSGGRCENFDNCFGVDCGAHGSCVDGSCVCSSVAYSGEHCEIFDKCHGVNCGSHGSCVNGICECKDRYTGSTCTNAPLPCASQCCECGIRIGTCPCDCCPGGNSRSGTGGYVCNGNCYCGKLASC